MISPDAEQGRKMIPVEAIDLLMNIDDLLERVEAYLNGEIIKRTQDGFLVKESYGKPLLNKDGIQEIMSIMRKRLDNIIYSTSNLDMDFVRTEVYYFNVNMAELIARKAKKWNLRREQYQELIDYLTSAFEAILRKGIGALYLRSILGGYGAPERKGEDRKKKFLFF